MANFSALTAPPGRQVARQLVRFGAAAAPSARKHLEGYLQIVKPVQSARPLEMRA